MPVAFQTYSSHSFDVSSWYLHDTHSRKSVVITQYFAYLSMLFAQSASIAANDNCKFQTIVKNKYICRLISATNAVRKIMVTRSGLSRCLRIRVSTRNVNKDYVYKTRTLKNKRRVQYTNRSRYKINNNIYAEYPFPCNNNSTCSERADSC